MKLLAHSAKRVFGVVIALTFSSAVSADVIELHSGNGVLGGTDSDISFLLGPLDAGFSDAFDAADFAAARSGSHAAIIAKHSAWATPAHFANGGGNPNAQWISDSAGGASQGASALYAIDFENTFDTTTAASLDFYWAVDNFLGDLQNSGLFINGHSVAGVSGGEFSQAYTALNIDVTSLLVAGTNTLYINSRDIGGPGGLMFSATLDVQGTNSVPAPATLLLLSLGLLALRFRTRH